MAWVCSETGLGLGSASVLFEVVQAGLLFKRSGGASKMTKGKTDHERGPKTNPVTNELLFLPERTPWSVGHKHNEGTEHMAGTGCVL